MIRHDAERDRFDELFAHATALDPAGRAAFLRDLGAAEPALAGELASLLRHHVDDAFLSPDPAGLELIDAVRGRCGPTELAPGTRVGEFTILRRIGRGGAATVYEAEQESPRRAVALKVMRGEFAQDRAALRRFRDEAAALARLRHPDIAQVYAFGIAGLGGTGAADTPYLAVELVPQARTVTEWVERARPTIIERVRLLATVCDAVAHGHARGILHRDLKPANILVDGDGRPRVIDFGVARILERPGDTSTAAELPTVAGAWVGTPAYMSPEQFDGDPRDLDVRSDVYSIGVVLYETLLGRRPIDVPTWSATEAARLVRTLTPPAPRSLDRSIDRDLETIVLVALGKEREDRHESMIALRDDLAAWCERRPIASRRPTPLRRLSLAARRNPPAAAAIVAAALIACVGLVATVRFAQRASAERDAAEVSLRHFASVLDTPIAERDGERTRFADVLAHVARTLDDDRATPPLVEARVRRMIGRGFDSLGLIPAAGGQFNRAVGILRAAAPGSPELAAALTDAIGPMYDENRVADAEALGREALTIELRELGPRHPDTARTMNELGILALRQGRTNEAFPLILETFRVRQDVLGNEEVETGVSLANLGAALLRLGDVAMGEALAREALAWSQATSSPPQHVANRMRLVALCRAEAGDHDGAIESVDGAIALLLAHYGPTHPSVISAHQRRAELLCAADRVAEALDSARESLRLARACFPPDSPAVADAAEDLADMETRAAPAGE